MGQELEEQAAPPVILRWQDLGELPKNELINKAPEDNTPPHAWHEASSTHHQPSLGSKLWKTKFLLQYQKLAKIEAIVQEAAQGTISSSDALNIRLENQVNSGTSSQSQGGSLPIPTALKNFSMSQKEKTLDEFVWDKWLSFTAEGHVGLGVRSFLDLRSWFRNNDVPSCEVCNEAGVKAGLCQKEGCLVRIHQYCLGKLFAKKKGERVCPSCGTQWQYTGPKAEPVEDDEPDCATQSQPPVEPKRKKLRTSRIGDVPSRWACTRMLFLCKMLVSMIGKCTHFAFEV
ncbi:uncharacterized protein LOC133744770 [Rosa rugosa]|uniref:uncharacterized protein LOC133744770 n=1 Tax=Rosa rugosa TaxID=74645 RepID=UPI002B402F4D|nr:uncharacterized protein LOC133744770 [Rosa rugosa]